VLINGGLGVPAARLTAINAAYQAALDAIAAGPAKAGGIATGQAAAVRLRAGARRTQRAGLDRVGRGRLRHSVLILFSGLSGSV
jgi:hypothetical protein